MSKNGPAPTTKVSTKFSRSRGARMNIRVHLFTSNNGCLHCRQSLPSGAVRTQAMDRVCGICLISSARSIGARHPQLPPGLPQKRPGTTTTSLVLPSSRCIVAHNTSPLPPTICVTATCQTAGTQSRLKLQGQPPLHPPLCPTRKLGDLRSNHLRQRWPQLQLQLQHQQVQEQEEEQ